jgi:hypothetical protein
MPRAGVQSHSVAATVSSGFTDLALSNYATILIMFSTVDTFFLQVLNEISQHKIKIYEFPDTEDEEETKLHKVLRDRVPFAVVGSNTVIEIDGKKIRGRKYPWGIAEGTDF